MAQANRYTGKALVMTIGGTPVGADYKSVSVKQGIESADATGGVDTHEFALPTYATDEVTVEIFGVKKADANYAALMSNTAVGSTAALLWGPEGGSGGVPKFTAAGFVESRDIEYKFDDAVNIKFTYKCTAAIVETTYT